MGKNLSLKIMKILIDFIVIKMRFDIQLKLKENPLYIKFIRENSYWYKTLNRNPDMFNNMVSEMKEKYKIRTTDKINNIVDGVDLITKFLKVTSE